MVKDVVKSECQMIDMWSSVWGGRSARKSLRRKRRNLQSAEKKHTNCHMWSSSRKEMITMWSEMSAAKSRELPCPSSAGVVL